MKTRDSQRQRLYNWEDRVVRSADSTQPVVKRAIVRSKRPSPTYVLVDVKGSKCRMYKASAATYGYESEPYFASRIETTVVGGLTLEQAQEFVDRVSAAYGLRRIPQVEFSGKRFARAHGLSRINLPTWARSFTVAAHEVAHAICTSNKAWLPNRPYLYDADSWAPHGPEFLAVFIDILSKHLFYDRIELRNSARAAGLEVADKAYPLEVA